MINKKLLLILWPALSLAPISAFAAEAAPVNTSLFHFIYEKSFGPIGAIGGILAIIIFLKLSKNAERTHKYTLITFVAVLSLISIGSITFGIHGLGLLDGETSRYIERTCRLAALLLADILALSIYLKMNKNQLK